MRISTPLLHTPATGVAESSWTHWLRPRTGHGRGRVRWVVALLGTPLEPRGKDMTHTGIAALVAQGFGLLVQIGGLVSRVCSVLRLCLCSMAPHRAHAGVYQSGLEHCLLAARA